MQTSFLRVQDSLKSIPSYFPVSYSHNPRAFISVLSLDASRHRYQMKQAELSEQWTFSMPLLQNLIRCT